MEQPSQDLALRYINEELDHFRANERRAGWSAWAFLGAIGGLGWIGLGLWEAHSVDLADLATLAVVISFPVDYWGGWLLSWLRGIKWSEKGRRFVLFSDAERRRAAYAYWALREAALGMVVLSAGIQFAPPVRWLLAGWYFLYAMMSGAAVAASYLDWPFNLFPGTKRVRVAGYLFQWALFVWALWYFYASVPIEASGSSLRSFRVALLLVVISLLLFGLLWNARPSREVDHLVELRRRLMAGQLEPVRAMREAEWAVAGLDGAGIIERALWGLADRQAQYEELVLSAEASLQSILDGSAPSQEDTPAYGAAIALFTASQEMATMASSLEVAYGKKRKALNQRIGEMVRLAPWSVLRPGATETFMGALQTIDQRWQCLRSRMEAIRTAIDPDTGQPN